jgi:ElaB/YqjD/DUF883 family membrane-anchored ribosome-binding protein
MDNGATTLPQDLGQLRTDIDRLKADVTLLRRDLTNFAEDAFHAARAGAGEVKAQFAQGAQAANQTLSEQLAARPVVTLASAIGVGLILGIGLSRARCN